MIEQLRKIEKLLPYTTYLHNITFVLFHENIQIVLTHKLYIKGQILKNKIL